MKRTLALLLILGLILSFGGCGAAPSAEVSAPTAEETSANQTPETQPTQAPAAQEETTRPALEGSLYLTVSSITFSLVGDSEDIYLGLIPRELVTWESENPEIISVENGVLTAVGVGTTVIHASYEDRQVSCTAGCLAQTREELTALEPEILSAPMRLPPEVDLSTPCTMFDDAAIVGDSIVYFLWQAESKNDYLGAMTFLSRHGISIHSLVNHSKNMYFEGQEMHIEDIVGRLDVQRIYIMLGCLDFQVPASTLMLMDHWNLLLDRIEENAPGVEIVIISNIPCFTEKTEPTDFNLEVEKATVQLRQLAEDRGYGFLELGLYVQDHYGRMPASYCQDEFHMNEEGSLVWMKLLRLYVQLEQEAAAMA